MVTAAASGVHGRCIRERTRSPSPVRAVLVDRFGFRRESTDHVDVDVVSGLLGATTSLEPAYEEVHPNGPDCPPSCHQGSTQVMVEAGVDCEE